MISLFKDEGLSITFDTNLIETDVLDFSFKFKYRKILFFKETE